MWYLREEPDVPTPASGVAYWFGGVASTGRTIGRKNVDIRLKASSVSRTHAIIRVKRSSFHPASNGTVPTVEDSSAYGTFLKYPPGHPANRATRSDGHHDRLDKDTPVELSDGALLAFGAPSAWWRVGWYQLLVFPLGLDERQKARLEEVSLYSGLAIAKNNLPPRKWVSDVTHIVTPVARATSQSFLRALVSEKHIVQPAWADAVANMASEACKTASLAVSVEAAYAATEIPSPKLYTPSFCEEDVAAFEAGVLAQAFDSPKYRKLLFVLMTFVFMSEERRLHWCELLEQCGGRTLLFSAGIPLGEKTILVNSEDSAEDDEFRRDCGASCSERDIIVSILKADADNLRKASRNAAPQALQIPAPIVPDVATPTPSDSDAETADNDAVEADVINSAARSSDKKTWKRSHPTEEDDAADRVHDSDSVANEDSIEKRSKADMRTSHVEKRSRHEPKEVEPIVQTSNPSVDMPGADEIEAMNPRSFFAVPCNISTREEISNMAQIEQEVSESPAIKDVRRFRRQSSVVAPRMHLQKARYTDEQIAQKHFEGMEQDGERHWQLQQRPSENIDVDDEDVDHSVEAKNCATSLPFTTGTDGQVACRNPSRDSRPPQTEE